METITIVDEKIKQDKNGNDFANVKLKDGRSINLMFENFDHYKGPGTYTAEIERDGNFWKVKPKSLYLAQNGTAIESEPETKAKTSLTQSRPSSNQVDTNRAILVQVCIKSAAEAYGGRPGVPEHDNVIELAKKFLEFAEKALNNDL